MKKMTGLLRWGTGLILLTMAASLVMLLPQIRTRLTPASTSAEAGGVTATAISAANPTGDSERITRQSSPEQSSPRQNNPRVVGVADASPSVSSPTPTKPAIIIQPRNTPTPAAESTASIASAGTMAEANLSHATAVSDSLSPAEKPDTPADDPATGAAQPIATTSLSASAAPADVVALPTPTPTPIFTPSATMTSTATLEIATEIATVATVATATVERAAGASLVTDADAAAAAQGGQSSSAG